MPSSGRISLLHQPSLRRYVLHLTYASPLQRGRCLVIEDLPELRAVGVSLRLPEAITSLQLIPDCVPLPMALADGVVSATIPSFSCHCAVVAGY